jgi:octaprenyl-diphosphate synthase
LVLAQRADQSLRQVLARELSEVGRRFEAELHSDLACVNALAEHVREFRGKMLRPMLVMVSGMAAGQAADGEAADLTDEHRVVATVVEMVHMATLVHDDVLDEAQVRRSGRTVSALHGNEAAVMLGDYLISHAYRLCSSLGEQWIAQTVADTTNTVCEGELLQLSNRDNWGLDEAVYFDIIRRKTASLCGTCCALGASLAGADEVTVSRLGDYGTRVGIAFQIVDDVLDLVGDEQTVGKSVRLDVTKGKLTLPLIHHLAHVEHAAREDLVSALRGGGRGQSNGRCLSVLMHQTSSLEYARERATKLVAEAKASIGDIRSSPASVLLADMADAVLTRKF